MCTNHTGIGSLPEATFTRLRYPSSNLLNGTASERTSDNRDWDGDKQVKSAMLDL